MTNQKTWRLRSGKRCRLLCPRLPLLPRVHVLSVDPGQGSHTEEDAAELLALAYVAGRRLGERFHGDPECFTLLVNGRRSGRRPWLHVHVLPARSPADKHRMLLLLAFKRALRRLLGRPDASAECARLGGAEVLAEAGVEGATVGHRQPHAVQQPR